MCLGPPWKFVSLAIPPKPGKQECAGLTHLFFAILPKVQLSQSAPASVSEECAEAHEFRRYGLRSQRRCAEYEQDHGEVPPRQSQEGTTPINWSALDLRVRAPSGCSAATKHPS